MNGSMLFALVLIGGIIFWLIGFVNDLDDDVNVSYGYSEKRLLSGEDTLEMSSFSINEKKKIWNNSNAKKEMLSLCPNFSEMRYLVEDKIEDTGVFKKGLLKHIESLQREFMSGKISSDVVKSKLSNY